MNIEITKYLKLHINAGLLALLTLAMFWRKMPPSTQSKIVAVAFDYWQHAMKANAA